MRVVLDGSVCFDRFGACFTYYTQLAPRLLARGCEVTVTPSPTGALDALNGSGAQVAQTLLPRGGWLPQGKLRRFLSRQKQAVERWRWNRKLEALEAPIFHSFYYGLPPRPDTVFVPMILDMIQEKYPDFHRNRELWDLKAACARRANRIITISETSKRDIVDIYQVSPDLIDVIYLGVDPAFCEPTPRSAIDAAKARHGLSRPYFLQVGGRAGHKNFSRLFEAYARFAPTENVDLVCAGEAWESTELDRINHYGLGRRVHQIYRPAQAELVALMHGAEALLYPSLYEGFGIPPVEAMASGIPVAASNAGSIAEVVGDAGILFDPLSVEEMTAALRRLRDPVEARELHRRGQIRIQTFDWDRIADQTLETYRRALEKVSSTAVRSVGKEPLLTT